MNFYYLWHETRKLNIDDAAFIRAFLLFEEHSLLPFISSKEEDLTAAYNLLNSISIERILEEIQADVFNETITPPMVPCFSNFENGAHRLIELLEFEPNGISFESAGFQLIDAATEGARVKYGENHAKLARMMSLVSITPHKPYIVKNTSWGSYLVRYGMAQKQNILKKLLLRDPCIHSIIHGALNGNISYADKVSTLSTSTAIRRRTNVKWLIEFVLTGTEYEAALLHIDWEV